MLHVIHQFQIFSVTDETSIYVLESQKYILRNVTRCVTDYLLYYYLICIDTTLCIIKYQIYY